MSSTLEEPPLLDVESQSELNEVEQKALHIKELMRMSLPTEIVERAKARGLKGEALERQLQEISEERAAIGLGTIIGFHISDTYVRGKELTGDVHYSTSLQALYAGKPQNFLYVVEGASNDEEYDERLHWRRSRGGSIRILYGTRLTPELFSAIGASFADCEYHHL